MKLIGLVRLGRDAEVRYTPSGLAVCEFSGAYNFGKAADGERKPVQWVDFKVWGDRGEKLSPYLLKGQQVMLVASDVHIEKWEGRDGTPGFKLTARVDDLEFAGPRPGAAADSGGAGRPAGAPAPAPAPKPRPATGTGFDSMDDDIPF